MDFENLFVCISYLKTNFKNHTVFCSSTLWVNVLLYKLDETFQKEYEEYEDWWKWILWKSQKIKGMTFTELHNEHIYDSDFNIYSACLNHAKILLFLVLLNNRIFFFGLSFLTVSFKRKTWQIHRLKYYKL